MSATPFDWAEQLERRQVGTLGASTGPATGPAFASGYDKNQYGSAGIVEYSQFAFDYFKEAGIFNMPNLHNASSLNYDSSVPLTSFNNQYFKDAGVLPQKAAPGSQKDSGWGLGL